MSEIKDKIQEIMDDLNGRIRNPLILTFILVWTYHHWSFLYILLSSYPELTSTGKLTMLKDYVKFYGFGGMVLCPLAWSFISLFAYYLIAILAQAIKVIIAKRLNAHMLQRFDTGNFETKENYNKLKEKSKKSEDELTKVNAKLEVLEKEKSEQEIKLNEAIDKHKNLQIEYNKVNSNINYNIGFVKKNEELMIFLLAKSKGIKSKLFNEDLIPNLTSIMDGNWEFGKNAHSLRFEGVRTSVIINNGEMRNTDGSLFGTIQNLFYDRKNNIISFYFTESTQRQFEKKRYELIKLNDNELIGFVEDYYIFFERIK